MIRRHVPRLLLPRAQAGATPLPRQLHQSVPTKVTSLNASVAAGRVTNKAWLITNEDKNFFSCQKDGTTGCERENVFVSTILTLYCSFQLLLGAILTLFYFLQFPSEFI